MNKKTKEKKKQIKKMLDRDRQKRKFKIGDLVKIRGEYLLVLTERLSIIYETPEHKCYSFKRRKCYFYSVRYLSNCQRV